MNKWISVLFLLASAATQAATFETVGTFGSDTHDRSSNYFYSDGDMDEDPPSSNLNIRNNPVTGLQQFDPAMGTLTGITISASFTLDATVSIDVFETVDEFEPHQAGFTMTNGLQNGIGTLIRYNASTDAPSFTRSLLNQEFVISTSCSGAAFEFCSNTTADTFTFTESGNVFDNVNIFRNLEPEDYLGTGTLDGLINVASVIYDGQLWNPGVDTVNILEAEGGAIATINAGTVTITYSFTPIPIPAALWLFGGAVGALCATRRCAR